MRTIEGRSVDELNAKFMASVRHIEISMNPNSTNDQFNASVLALGYLGRDLGADKTLSLDTMDRARLSFLVFAQANATEIEARPLETFPKPTPTRKSK